ncbi:hypothetical protein QAD02_018054 [Eretmocerus hayati]|uniref:Uncharacterized protein n=1 Tax=Eretmocerus hayati TaxID=131215 RepID=A0ACC2PFL7_9HYME|nr:hypothetical protein QAD02_018054 [Eretmocerus hayati]
MTNAELTPDDFQNSFNNDCRANHVQNSFNRKCSANPDSTYDSATTFVSYDANSIPGANDEVVIEFRDATDLFSNNCVRTQVENMKEAAHKQRVEEIAADLMSYEQIGNAQIPNNIFLQLGVEPSTQTTQPLYRSNMSESYEKID